MTLIRLLTSVATLAVATTGMAQAADMPVKARPLVPVVEQQASGYVEVYGGWSTTKFSDLPFVGPTLDNLDGWTLGGAGRGNYWLAPNMSMQLDAQAEGTSYKLSNFGPGTNFNSSSLSYLIGGHFNWRDSQRGLLGVFAAAGDQGSFFADSRRHVTFGGEGQIYWNQFTLYVQGGYDTTAGTHIIEPSSWFVRGTGRYFFTPNTMLEGTVLYADGEIESGFGGPGSINFESWLWEAKLEHRFAATPFSLYVKYRGTETKLDTPFFGGPFNDQFKVTEHRVLAGLRLYMGQNTLLSNDRQGATLDIKDVQSLLLPAFNN